MNTLTKMLKSVVQILSFVADVEDAVVAVGGAEDHFQVVVSERLWCC